MTTLPIRFILNKAADVYRDCLAISKTNETYAFLSFFSFFSERLITDQFCCNGRDAARSEGRKEKRETTKTNKNDFDSAICACSAKAPAIQKLVAPEPQ